ncbi:MAG: M23 family metallopeptidase [Bacteroidales bacterium]|nr:M23 family metallopeptidase [Bacteroidales bacterium]MCL2738250.1 M23 family metallopeptidase [Bacteroidales bacterium]
MGAAQKYILFLGLWFYPLSAQAQSASNVYQDFPTYFRSPLNIPISLSGNYGEFRSNHFHTGYDMRIGGVVGERLFAVADGFVVRISVSPSGYGNALYIEHPNGITSVYGHMLDFAPAIQSYVTEKQYERQSFAVDIPCAPELFPVKQGDFIGRAGNSGASSGPHLHFELRNTQTQCPLNYSAFGLFPVTDRIPPTLTRLQFYGYSLQSGVPRTKLLRAVDLRASSALIPVSDTFYVAMGAYDRKEGSNSFLSLSKYEVYINEEKVYTYKKQGVAAGQGRYLHAFLQYDLRVRHNQSLLKTWVEPGNILQHKVESSSKGLFVLPDTLEHQLKIVLTDDYGNTSTYRYRIAKRAAAQVAPQPLKGRPLIWALDHYYESDSLDIYLPMGALCKNTDFYVAQTKPPQALASRFYAPLWSVGNPEDPLFRPMRLRLRTWLPDSLREKAVVVSVSSSGRYTSIGGQWNGDMLEARTYNFGRYTVAVDTVPPVISAGFKDGADLRGTTRIRFTIRDELSGIKSYQGYINGQWALFVYDAKNSALSYTFDRRRIGSGKRHELELRVTDNCNNVNIYKTSFTW